MSQVIECPGCDKRFRLGDTPPATYTCKQCGTVMDLSDFGGAAQPEPAAAAAGAAPATRTQRRRGTAGAPRGRSSGGGSGRPSASRSRSAARGGSRSGSRRQQEDDYEDDYRPRGREKKSNAGLILIFSTVGLVLIAILIAVATKKDDAPGPTDPSAVARGGVTNGGVGAGGGMIAGGGATGVGVGAGAGMGVGTAPARSTNGGPAKSGSDNRGPSGPAASNPGDDEPVAAPRPKRMGRRNLRKIDLKAWPYPDEVTAEERPKIEEAMVALMRGDRYSMEAADYLVGLGRKVGGRLITEFKTIQDNEGFEGRQGRIGRSKASVLDATLRKMDGWIERRWQTEDILRVTSQPDKVLGFARRWTVWWMDGHWKSNPREPWDPTVDRLDVDKPKVDKKKEEERKGWDKRDK